MKPELVDRLKAAGLSPWYAVYEMPIVETAEKWVKEELVALFRNDNQNPFTMKISSNPPLLPCCG